MKIAIDAGHGMGNRRANVFDSGTTFRDASGVTFAEADIVLDYAKTFKEILLQNDIDFFMTRTSSSDNDPVSQRATRARAAGCTHFVAFHVNAPAVDNDPAPNGIEVLYRSTIKDEPLAQALESRLVQVTGLHNRGFIQRNDLAVLRFQPGPAVLIELGFLPNSGDRAFMINRDNRIAICRAIFGTITGQSSSLLMLRTDAPQPSTHADSVAARVAIPTDAAAPRQLVGDGTWFFTGTVDGNDIVVQNIDATFFGGDNDPTDNGVTASGVVTRGHPDVMGCALPMRVPHSPRTVGSPIPRLPFGTQVRVFCHQTRRQITVPLIDVGPAKRTHHALDLTEAAFNALGVSSSQGVMSADFRILGGAAHIVV